MSEGPDEGGATVEPARKQQIWGTVEEGYRADREEPEREVPEWETKLGKIIFYVTCALSIWFFYWLNGIQCPC